MVEFDEVVEPVRTERETLADMARNELMFAGLPVPHGDDGPGAVFEVDFGADAAGGVFVKWHADGRLRTAAAQSVLAGRLTDPAIRRSGRISLIMRDAIISILNEAGYAAEPSDDDMRPAALRVRSGPPAASA